MDFTIFNIFNVFLLLMFYLCFISLFIIKESNNFSILLFMLVSIIVFFLSISPIYFTSYLKVTDNRLIIFSKNKLLYEISLNTIYTIKFKYIENKSPMRIFVAVYFENDKIFEFYITRYKFQSKTKRFKEFVKAIDPNETIKYELL